MDKVEKVALELRQRKIIVFTLLLMLGILLSSFPNALGQEQRNIRSLETIPRPKELSLGLSQIEYKGFFSRDSGWFSDSRYVSSVTRNSTTSPSGITGIDSAFANVSTSYSFTGYFISDETGEWQFQLTADDAALVWFGNDAVVNYASRLNSPLLEAYWPEKNTVTGRISLIKNKIYPIRIQYGNSGGPSAFILKFKSPGETLWEDNFSTLLWRSPELVGDCTNFGLSYTLASELGYDSAIPAACKKDGADKYKRSWIKPKPELPSLISTKIIYEGLVLEVSLGDIDVSKSYLIAPGIGYTVSSNLAGKISKKTATFLIPITKLKSISKIDVSFVSSNDQGSTTTAKKAIPVVLASKSSVPSSKPTSKNTVPAPKTIRCEKGDKTRVFAGTICPPGWSK